MSLVGVWALGERDEDLRKKKFGKKQENLKRVGESIYSQPMISAYCCM